MAARAKTRPVIVTTEHRGVFFGDAADTTGEQIVLENARMAIYWGTTGGILQLAQTGPTSKSRIGSVAPRIELRKITAVIDVTPEAEKKWREA